MALQLTRYDFDIIIGLEKLNSTVDALSCIRTSQFFSIAFTEFALLDRLQTLNKSDPTLLELRRQLENDLASLSFFSFHRRLLFYRNRLVIPLE